MSILSDRASESEKNAFSTLQKSANSGRSKKDGDFKTDDIVFDNKLQTKTLDWKIKRFELDKVRIDAIRCGRKFGALVLENAVGRRIVVMEETEFVELLTLYGIVE